MMDVGYVLAGMASVTLGVMAGLFARQAMAVLDVRRRDRRISPERR